MAAYLITLETILYKYTNPVKFSRRPDTDGCPGHLHIRVTEKSRADMFAGNFSYCRAEDFQFAL